MRSKHSRAACARRIRRLSSSIRRTFDLGTGANSGLHAFSLEQTSHDQDAPLSLSGGAKAHGIEAVAMTAVFGSTALSLDERVKVGGRTYDPLGRPGHLAPNRSQQEMKQLETIWIVARNVRTMRGDDDWERHPALLMG